jgi:Ser/Thr protein kinase RdoA (MazF antagonist)
MDLVERYGLRALSVDVIVDRRGRCVAKVMTERGPVVVKVDSQPDAFVPERAAIGRLGAAGLPVPAVVGYADEKPAHLVMSWIDGEGLSSASSDSAQRAAGRLLRRVHALPGGPPYAGNDSIDLWIAGWLNHAMAWWASHAEASAERVAGVWNWFDDLRPLLATRGGETMLFDGRPEHFIVNGDDIAGMIDLHDTCSGDAAMDFAVLAVSDPPLLAGVLAGYEPNGDERAAFDRLIPFYLFLRRLAAAQWQLEHGDPAEAPRLLELADGGMEYPTPP